MIEMGGGNDGGAGIAEPLKHSLTKQGSQTVSTEPEHRWGNGSAERFIGRVQEACVNENVFGNACHVLVVVEWRRHPVNEERPWSVFGIRASREFAEEN